VAHGHSGVFLAYARVDGHAWLARALSRPQVGTDDRARGPHAGGPAAPLCATTPPLARHRLQRACDAGVPAAWVTGESVYGAERRRWVGVAEQDHADVRAVSGQAEVWRAGRQPHGKSVLAALRTEGWERWSAGDGTPGPRWSDGRWLPLAAPWPPAGRRGLLVRRRLRAPAALPASVVLAPPATTLATVGQVAGSRWTMARSCAEAQGDGGLEHSAGRSGTGGERPSTVVRWA
jgi:SRSO17 transposase